MAEPLGIVGESSPAAEANNAPARIVLPLSLLCCILSNREEIKHISLHSCDCWMKTTPSHRIPQWEAGGGLTLCCPDKGFVRGKWDTTPCFDAPREPREITMHCVYNTAYGYKWVWAFAFAWGDLSGFVDGVGEYACSYRRRDDAGGV